MASKNETNLMSLQILLENYGEIVIPSIQRDYVMGGSNDIFARLKKDMNHKKYYGDFDFGCIVGCRDDVDKNSFYVYDGQQRIVTLVFLTAYKLSQEKKYINDVNLKRTFTKLIRKFKFENRGGANRFLEMILNNNLPTKNDIDDLTTSSIIALLENSQDLYIDADYLFTKVKFKLEEVDKKGFAEQLFLDLNEGVPLKNYEIFKSELNYCVNKLLELPENKSNEIILDFFNQIDNKWLNWIYLNFSSKCSLNKIEEVEMRILLFIIKMSYLEKYSSKEEVGNYSDKLPDSLINERIIELSDFDTVNLELLVELCDVETLTKIYTIMEDLTSVVIENPPDVMECQDFYIVDGDTCYLNLKFDNYNSFAFSTIMSFISPKMEHKFLDEAMFWCYLCTLKSSKANSDSYMRLIKKLFNNNRYDDKALIYRTNSIYKDSVSYGRYKVVGCKNYYEHSYHDFRVNKTALKEFLCRYVLDVILFNKLVSHEVAYLSTIKLIDVAEDNRYSDKFKSILSDERKKQLSYSSCRDIILYENNPFFNGVVFNMLVQTGKIDSPYKVIIPYSDYEKGMSKIKKQSKADILLGRLQSYCEDFLLLPATCCWSDNKNEVYASFASTIDLLTCEDNKISSILKKSWSKIFLTSDYYGSGKYSWVSAYLQKVDRYTKKVTFKGKYIYSNNERIEYYTLFSYLNDEAKFAFVPHSIDKPSILPIKTQIKTCRFNETIRFDFFDDTWEEFVKLNFH